MASGNNYMIVVEGLTELGSLADVPANVSLSAVQAINRTLATTRTESAARILRQINFPESYLNPGSKRLFVSRLATRGKPEGAITARRRPTSLARFVTGSLSDKQVGVKVRVKKGGRTEDLKRAFVIRLNSGTDTKGNFGLAVRLRRGETLRNRATATKMANGLYLLYGPSVQQVFLDNQGEGVAADMAPIAADKLADEFQRLFDLRLR